jgi:hypothetical protein
MARPTPGDIDEIAQLRKEGDLGAYIRHLGGMTARPRPAYLTLQCPRCGAPQNQMCTGHRGMMLSAGVHEARIRAISPEEQPAALGGSWPVGLPMKKEKEQVTLTNEQAIRAAALQAAVVVTTAISGDEKDAILLAEEFAEYIRSGPKGFQQDPQATPSPDAWSQVNRATQAQEFATVGFAASTKEQLGKVWREAGAAEALSVEISLGDGTRMELGAYLTSLAEKLKGSGPADKAPTDQTIRNDMGL